MMLGARLVAALVRVNLTRLFAVLAVAAVAAFAAPSGARAQSDTDIVELIAVQGNQRVEPATIRTYLTVREGDTFDPARIDRSIKNLFATSLFADV